MIILRLMRVYYRLNVKLWHKLRRATSSDPVVLVLVAGNLFGTAYIVWALAVIHNGG